MRSCAQMPYHAGITMRIYPSYKQKKVVAVNDGCKRFTYNRLVAYNDERYSLTRNSVNENINSYRISYLDSILRNDERSVSTMIKNSAPFLYGEDVDTQSIENAVKNYKTAWKMFREVPGTSVPTFHKKTYEQSYQTNAHYYSGAKCINDGNVRFEDAHHIILPIIGRIRISGSIERIKELLNRTDTRIGTITISKDSIDRYYVSLQLASEQPFSEEYEKTGALVGLDLNLDNYLWDSDNNMVDNPKYRRNLQKKLAQAQKEMSRRAVKAKKDGRSLKESKNYQKSRIKVAYLQNKISARGESFRDNLSSSYVKNHDVIVTEDLKVKNLLKNHCLALSISEAGWSDFLGKLEYKSAIHGKTFIKVPPHYTTQTCSECGKVLPNDKRLTLGDREWICPECGAYHIRDYNAAKNILAKGLATLS